MKCYKCKTKMKPAKDIRLGSHKLSGLKCPSCGEAYLDPLEAQKVLLMNKLKKQKFRLKLSKIRSNLVLRIPKEVSDALGLENGEVVEFYLKGKDMVVSAKA